MQGKALALFFIAISLQFVANAKVVDVSLSSGWTETPLLGEGCEAMSRINEKHFWRCLEKTKPCQNCFYSQKEQYDELTKTVLQLIPEELRKLVLLEVSLRTFSPLLSMHRQLAQNDVEPNCINKPAFVHFSDGSTVCTFDELAKKIEELTAITCEVSMSSRIPEFDDHVFPSSLSAKSPCHTALLYGAIGTHEAKEMDQLLRNNSQKIRYVFRHHWPLKSDEWATTVALQGYGASLDIKNMEYKALDEKRSSSTQQNATFTNVVSGFNFETLLRRKPKMQDSLLALRHALLSASSLEQTYRMKVWQLQNVGNQCIDYVVNSVEPLAALRGLTQNFPMLISNISKRPFASHNINEAASFFGEGQTTLWVNRRLVSTEKADVFSIVEDIREEETENFKISAVLFGESTKNPKAEEEAAILKVKSCPFGQGADPNQKNHQRLWIDDRAISWINNIEEDEAYAYLGVSVKELTKVTYYGQPRIPRRNLLHLVYVIDPTKRADLAHLASVQRMLEQGVAVRIGVVLTCPNEGKLSLMIMATFEFLLRTVDTPAYATKFLSALHTRGEGSEVTLEVFNGVFAEFVHRRSLDSILQDRVLLERVGWVQNYTQKLGLDTHPLAVFNGVVFKDNIDAALYQGFHSDISIFRSWVTKGELKDDEERLYDWVHQKLGASKRYQRGLFEPPEFVLWEAPRHESVLRNAIWFYSTSYDYVLPRVSNVVAVCMSSTRSLDRILEALKHYTVEPCKSCKLSRVSFLLCDTESNPELSAVVHAILVASSGISERKRVDHVLPALEIIRDSISQGMSAKDAVALVIKKIGPKYAYIPDRAFNSENMRATGEMCSGLAIREDAVFSNGRVIHIGKTEFFAEDYDLLEAQQLTPALEEAVLCLDGIPFVAASDRRLTEDDINNDFLAAKFFLLQSVLGYDIQSRGLPVPQTTFPSPKGKSWAFEAGNNAGRHHIDAAINPLSRESQKAVSIIYFLAKNLNVSCTIYLNPSKGLTRLPIVNFYEFVAVPQISFSTTTGNIEPPRAVFHNVPAQVTLTLSVDDPEAWMVFAATADADMDNIRFDATGGDRVAATYTLQSILVTGSCVDSTTESAPRGLPLIITQSEGKYRREDGARDTLVMSNYGYFQLPCSPGVWSLSIQEGKASEIYSIVGVSNFDERHIGDDSSGEILPQASIIVSSFTGRKIYLRVKKNVGKEGESILVDSVDSTRPATPSWPPVFASPPAQPPEKPTLNIFSLASGHLYERFLRIMLYTATKASKDRHGANTTKIKFWLMENYLSPKFKASIPKLASKFGFEFGFVSYRWPHWVQRQTEKQRTMWGFKILFLDVLFPLSVEKIIFVDADQIVLGDLHDLYNLDLQGKPVAYTPFCQEARRNETAGFRFWESGYWVDHLRGLPYHISAIYVVDLKKLRRMAAGDQYRMIYDNLAQDPNSLSNLDQDLPNYAQHQVPIFSLPEEWLWCETWCDDKSKERAKTIDLCNNPLTKTPKLENAKRIIPQWTEMDEMLTKIVEEKEAGRT